MSWTIEKIFNLVTERKASDVCFVPGSSPVIWTAGKMCHVGDENSTPAEIDAIFLPLLNDQQRERLNITGDIDLSVGQGGVGRFRINMHRQRGSLSVALRFIPHDVPQFESLHIPQRVLQFADLQHGLVLVTGGAGTGKSTTLAAMIDYMNRKYAYHIITMEDPIEFTFRHGKSVIEQREVGVDCPSFGSALRHVVRQRPDVILVGEMRDLETIAAALTAAETGHLVMASLHTINATQTIDRIIDVFPAAQQSQIRVQLAGALRGVVCQTLLPDEKNGGLVPAVEVMVCNQGIQRAIRDNESHLLPGMIETGKSLGMQLMDSAILELVKSGRVSSGEAIARAHNPEKMIKMVA